MLVVSPRWATATQPDFLTDEERAWLDQNPDALTLWFDTQFPPLEFISDTGEFVGMGADIVGRIEELLGVTFVRKASSDWNAHLAALRRGECAVAPTIVRTREREAYAYFTLPYATVPVVLITTRAEAGRLTMGDLDGLRVGVVSGYATERYVREQPNADRYEVVTVSNVPEGLKSVAFGQLDVFVENLAVTAYFIEEIGLPNLRVAGHTDFFFAWSIGVSREYPLLYNAVLKALDSISEEDLAQIRSRWITLDTDSDYALRILRTIWVIALVILFVVLALLGITAVLKKRLVRSEAAYRTVFNSVSDAICIYDVGKKCIVDANTAVLDLFGYTPDEARSKTLGAVSSGSPSYTEEGVDAFVRKAASGESQVFEWQCRHKSGRLFWAEITLRPAVIGGGDCVLAMARDITANRVDKQLVEAKNEELERVVYVASHDLRSPLVTVDGYSREMEYVVADLVRAWEERGESRENLEDALRKAVPEMTEALGFIRNGTRQMDALLKALLNLSRLGRTAISVAPLDMNTVVACVISALEYQAREANATLRLADLPSCHGDEVLVTQVFSNLIGNALKFLHPDRLGEITVSGSANDGRCEYCVEDNGIGIAPDQQERIFELFYRLDPEGSKGEGLGLAIVKQILNRLNGDIRVESTVNEGSRFYVTLPHAGASGNSAERSV